MKELNIAGVCAKHVSRKFPIWTCNNGYKFVPHISRLFIMHKQVCDKGIDVFNWEDINQQAEQGKFTVVKLHDVEELKGVFYPLQSVLDYFKIDYFSSSFDYMVALALYERFEVLHLWDVDFFPGVSDTDDLYEKCGLEHWIGRALGMGVAVAIHGKSNLLQTSTGKRYAIDG